MKIEIGESLLLSWLRHAKSCQLVQTNWKPSVSSWKFEHEETIQQFMDESKQFFIDKHNLHIYKANSLEQLIQQAEIDVFGISYADDRQKIYAIDVAFHEAGLNYGSKELSTARVIKKCLRTAMCVYGYFGHKEGEIIFASPKIYNNIMEILIPCVEDAMMILKKYDLNYKIRIIANDDFRVKVLNPVLAAASLIADTSELFMRSIQMYNLFGSNELGEIKQQQVRRTRNVVVDPLDTDSTDEMKIGAFVRSTLIRMFQDNEISKQEVELLQTTQYSKDTFDLQYPVLRKASLSNGKKPPRYWANAIEIYGTRYFICSEWYETNANNDRPYFLKWLNDKAKRKD
ncbi:hypothetical protein D1614_09510 [Maribellus luteus]|uniref:Uncharacterized protein n=1 Tax=Maribellus luteus TaxID=2305463 RepID=A0A399T3K9_9BACT|nr:hypothetical protein [Maribellus luteus]RIJ48757.1 hypothetical protein D1614_09510 [Maribellus luteus]